MCWTGSACGRARRSVSGDHGSREVMQSVAHPLLGAAVQKMAFHLPNHEFIVRCIDWGDGSRVSGLCAGFLRRLFRHFQGGRVDFNLVMAVHEMIESNFVCSKENNRQDHVSLACHVSGDVEVTARAHMKSRRFCWCVPGCRCGCDSLGNGRPQWGWCCACGETAEWPWRCPSSGPSSSAVGTAVVNSPWNTRLWA